MTLHEFIAALIATETEYREDIRPLHPDHGDGTSEDYSDYDQQYDEMLEDLHMTVRQFLQDNGHMEPQTK